MFKNTKYQQSLIGIGGCCKNDFDTRREFLKEILYNDIAIIAIHHSKINFIDTFGESSHTVE